MISLVLAFHNHQPVGNFGWVIESAYEKSYLPLMQVLAEYPEIRFAQHYTGILLDWFAQHHPEFTASVRSNVIGGRVELIGGGYYEPILAMLPERDRQAQLRKLSNRIEREFGSRPNGMWLAERVWEPSLPKTLNDAGLTYTFLDDTHFKHAGLADEDITGYFLTEDEGKPLAVFPIDKRLRYTMPFEKPETTIEYLHSLDRSGHDRLVVFADDGEKFGTWPGTHESVYARGWLRRFCELIRKNAGWLRTVLPGAALAAHRPTGRIYLPTASYSEMLHWALPSARSYQKYETFEDHLKKDGSLDQFGQFVRGGFWRNFLVKYPEANAMQKKMLRASERLARLSAEYPGDAASALGPSADAKTRAGGRGETTSQRSRATAIDAGDNVNGVTHPEASAILARAYEHLMAGQCNCPYWHGVFGGLYLSNIRAAIYRELIIAERELDSLERLDHARLSIVDYDVDGFDEVIIETPTIAIYISPARGGSIFELDHKPTGYNFCDVLQRRREGYHAQLTEAALKRDSVALLATASGAGDGAGDDVAAKSIHDSFKVKEEGLERRLVYDKYRHGLLIDHFYSADVSASDLRSGTETERGDFFSGAYEMSCGRHSDGTTRVHLRRQGAVDGAPVLVEKLITVNDNTADLDVEYRVVALDGRPLRGSFGIELCYSMSAGNEPDRYYEFDGKRVKDPAGRLASEGGSHVRAFALVDEWLRARISVSLAEPARVLRCPIETVSLSEDGFERNYQGSLVVAIWELGGATEWRMAMKQRIETVPS